MNVAPSFVSRFHNNYTIDGAVNSFINIDVDSEFNFILSLK